MARVKKPGNETATETSGYAGFGLALGPAPIVKARGIAAARITPLNLDALEVGQASIVGEGLEEDAKYELGVMRRKYREATGETRQRTNKAGETVESAVYAYTREYRLVELTDDHLARVPADVLQNLFPSAFATGQRPEKVFAIFRTK